MATIQNTKHLTVSQIERLLSNNCQTWDGREYCEESLRESRLVKCERGADKVKTDHRLSVGYVGECETIVAPPPMPSKLVKLVNDETLTGLQNVEAARSVRRKINFIIKQW